jgi:5-oxoprolinase (ATP-hydrolysing)
MTLASVYPEGVAVTTPGLFGGASGGITHGWLLDGDYRKIRDYGVGELATLTRTDQIIELQLAGGAGFGDPLERPLSLVEHDLANGYITANGAAEDFGCVIGADGHIDVAASERRRRDLREFIRQAAD